MGTPVARINDRCQGTCFHSSHVPPLVTGGSITQGSSDCIAEGMGIARLGDQVTTDCGHFGVINSAAATAIANGKGIARLGDTTSGDYISTIVSAASTTFAE